MKEAKQKNACFLIAYIKQNRKNLRRLSLHSYVVKAKKRLA